MCVCTSVLVCACARVRACVHSCARSCARAVVYMGGRTTAKSVRLKDKDYDVTPYIIAHLCAKSVTGR